MKPDYVVPKLSTNISLDIQRSGKTRQSAFDVLGVKQFKFGGFLKVEGNKKKVFYSYQNYARNQLNVTRKCFNWNEV